MNDNMLALVMHEAKGSIVATDSLEDRLRAAMKAAKGHWMVTDEDIQFKGAVAAVYVASTDEVEKKRIEMELAALAALAALIAGIPVDLERVVTSADPIGLRDLWQEA